MCKNIISVLRYHCNSYIEEICIYQHNSSFLKLCFFSFSGSSLPAGQEELKDWLTNRWRIKEETLTKFYASGSFQNSPSCNKEIGSLSLNGSLSEDSQVIRRNTKVGCQYDENYSHLPSHEQFHSTTLYLALMFWTLLCFIAIYGLLTSFLIQVFTVVNISLFLLLSFFSHGFHHIEISLFKFKTTYLHGWIK